MLITGAGGSIGNELVKQCLNFEPAEIICLDTSEEKFISDQFTNTLQSKTILVTKTRGAVLITKCYKLVKLALSLSACIETCCRFKV